MFTLVFRKKTLLASSRGTTGLCVNFIQQVKHQPLAQLWIQILNLALCSPNCFATELQCRQSKVVQNQL